MKPMRKFKVGVFVRPGINKKFLYTAYTLTYNPDWKDCIEVEVEAKNGTEAKKKAIAFVRAGKEAMQDVIETIKEEKATI